MTIKSDLAALDWAYRARRTGQSKVEFACAVEGYRRPRRNWPAWVVTLALIAGAALLRGM